MKEMAQRLAVKMPDWPTRRDFLTTVQYEATRAGLDTQLVLALIQHESNFRKFAVSPADARGFMQVMPFWVKQIGSPDQNLFHSAHQPALRLHDSAPLPRHGKWRSLSRAGSLQRQSGSSGISERRGRELETELVVGLPSGLWRCARGAGARYHDPVSVTPVYRGRFAPSPTGPLHFGSLVAAVASWCDARAHRGEWLLRIEDVDTPRKRDGASNAIIDTLTSYGFEWDGAVVQQSERSSLYQAAQDELARRGLAYRCACTRKELEHAPTGVGGERVYPGTCRNATRRAKVARGACAWTTSRSASSTACKDRNSKFLPATSVIS